MAGEGCAPGPIVTPPFGSTGAGQLLLSFPLALQGAACALHRDVHRCFLGLLEEGLWGWWQEAASLPGGPATPRPSHQGLASHEQQGRGQGAAGEAPTLARASTPMLYLTR